jgi:hypothetical protein
MIFINTTESRKHTFIAVRIEDAAYEYHFTIKINLTFLKESRG